MAKGLQSERVPVKDGLIGVPRISYLVDSLKNLFSLDLNKKFTLTKVFEESGP